MFPARYFPSRQFAPRYFPKVGLDVGFIESPRIVYVEFEDRSVEIEYEDRTVYVTEGALKTYRWPTKDPDSIKDYQSDWTDWLDGDTIATSDFTVPSGLTRQSQSTTTTISTVWLSGGTPGRTYSIVHRITTAAGRKDDRTIKLSVAEN